MKNKATGMLKKITTAVTAMAKAKTLALKTKTNSLKTKLIIFSLLSNKKFLMSSFSHKLHNFFSHHHRDYKLNTHDDVDIETADVGVVEDTAIVLYGGSMAHDLVPNPTLTEPVMINGENNNAHGFYTTYGSYDDDGGDEPYGDYDVDKYPDLTHSLFDSEDPGGSVIDIVKNSKEEAGESFNLEEEIDQVADLFIKRFHRQIKLQKMQSFKEFHERLELGL